MVLFLKYIIFHSHNKIKHQYNDVADKIRLSVNNIMLPVKPSNSFSYLPPFRILLPVSCWTCIDF